MSALFLKPLSTFTVSYYHTDAIGSVRAVTDSAGTALARHDYAPFGEDPVPLNNDPQPLRFAGKEVDLETALHYFEARYYRQTWGRFTQVDPASGWVTDPQSWNRYAYARNNPLKYVDPSGLSYTICGSRGGCTTEAWTWGQMLSEIFASGLDWTGDRDSGRLCGTSFGRDARIYDCASYSYICDVICDGPGDRGGGDDSSGGELPPGGGGEEEPPPGGGNLCQLVPAACGTPQPPPPPPPSGCEATNTCGGSEPPPAEPTPTSPLQRIRACDRLTGPDWERCYLDLGVKFGMMPMPRGFARLGPLTLQGPHGTRLLGARWKNWNVLGVDYGPFPGTKNQPMLHLHLGPNERVHIPIDPRWWWR